MKKIIILLLVFIPVLVSNLFTQDTIPNGYFENWFSNTLPHNWHTTNSMLPPGVVNCNQSGNSYEGDYALQLKTINMEGTIVPAVATLGELGFGYTIGGIPVNSRPDALNGYFIHPSSGDEVMVAIQFFKEGVEIGGGYWSTTDSVADYSQFSINITYATSENPDTMNITMLTDPWFTGSSNTVDALDLVYPVTEVQETKLIKPSVCPNPFENSLFIENTNQKTYSYEVINSVGQTVQHNASTNSREINTSDLQAGYYLLVIKTNNGIFTEKLIKF